MGDRPGDATGAGVGAAGAVTGATGVGMGVGMGATDAGSGTTGAGVVATDVGATGAGDGSGPASGRARSHTTQSSAAFSLNVSQKAHRQPFSAMSALARHFNNHTLLFPKTMSPSSTAKRNTEPASSGGDQVQSRAPSFSMSYAATFSSSVR